MADQIGGRFLAGITQELNNMGKAAGVAASQVNNLSSILKGAFVLAGIRAFNQQLEKTVDTVAEFNLEMTKVRAITNANDTEFKKLEKSARQLGQSTFFTARQVAQLQLAYSKLGFSTQEILKAQKATLDLALVTGEDLGRAAEVAGATIRGFGIDARETTRVVDVMTASFTDSALNLERFENSVKLVAPIAKSANVSLEAMTKIFANLADSGLSGTIAGTAMRNILIQLADPASDLSKTLGFAVDSTEDLTRAFQELADRNIDLADVAGLVERRQIAALLNTINTVEDYTAAYDDATGASERFANLIEDTLAGSMKSFESAVESVRIALLDSNGVMKDWFDNLTRIARTLALFIDDNLSWQEAMNEVTWFMDQQAKTQEELADELEVYTLNVQANRNAINENNKAIDEHNEKNRIARLFYQNINDDRIEANEELGREIGLYNRRIKMLREMLGLDIPEEIEEETEEVKKLNAAVEKLLSFKDRTLRQIIFGEVGPEGFMATLQEVQERLLEINDILFPEADTSEDMHRRLMERMDEELEKRHELAMQAKEQQQEDARRAAEALRLEELKRNAVLASISTTIGAFSAFAETSKGLFEFGKALAIAEALVSTSRAVINIWTKWSGVPGGPAIAAVEVAATLAQLLPRIAQIQAVQAPSAPQQVRARSTSRGFSEGGYTGDGARLTPAGIVHRGEYVVPAPVLKDKQGGLLVQHLEAMRSGKTIDLSRLFSSPELAGNNVNNYGIQDLPPLQQFTFDERGYTNYVINKGNRINKINRKYVA